MPFARYTYGGFAGPLDEGQLIALGQLNSWFGLLAAAQMPGQFLNRAEQ